MDTTHQSSVTMATTHQSVDGFEDHIEGLNPESVILPVRYEHDTGFDVPPRHEVVVLPVKHGVQRLCGGGGLNWRVGCRELVTEIT